MGASHTDLTKHAPPIATLPAPCARFSSLITLGAGSVGLDAAAVQVYMPITPTMSDQTVVLDGRDLTIEEIVKVARFGAKVELSADARQREADNYGLLLEAAAEGMSVYWFNRGTGDQRETVLFAGDATSAENEPTVERIATGEFSPWCAWQGSAPRSTRRKSFAP